MNRKQPHIAFSTPLAAAAFTLLAGASQPSLAARYTIEAIDGGEGKTVALHDISPNGKMTGEWCCNARSHEQPFVIRNGQFKKLAVQPDETARGWAINNLGVVMGESYSDSNSLRTFYEDDSGRHYIESDVRFVGREINKVGQIPGYRMAVDGSFYEAVIYSISDASFTTIPGDLGQVTPAAINDSGTVVADVSTSSKTACYIYQNNALTELPDLGGRYCFPADINNKGTAVGIAALPDDRVHAVKWENGVMTELLPDSYKSWALRINNHGQIVGRIKFDHPVSEKAFLYEGTKMTLAKDLLSPADTAHWSDFFFRGISDKGEIIGDGKLDGVARAFIMRPVP